MLQLPEDAQIPALTGAVVGALGGDAGLLPVQVDTLDAVTSALGHPEVDVRSADPLSPDEVAAALGDAAMRRQLIRIMVVLAFLEHPPNDDRLLRIREYARALGVDEQAVRVFGDYVHDHRALMMLDTYRYVPFLEWEKQFAAEEGWATVARSILATLGRSEAPELAARFRALESCPAGSWGRKVWEMYQHQGWPFPGERNGVPEPVTVHDWVHILSGYPPTPLGEIQVNVFIAAFSPDERMFGGVVLALGLYEAGAFKVPTFVAPPRGGTMGEDGAPAAFADAVRRGLEVNEDILEGVDHWALADQPVADLRRRFNIIPKDENDQGEDPGA